MDKITTEKGQGTEMLEYLRIIYMNDEIIKIYTKSKVVGCGHDLRATVVKGLWGGGGGGAWLAQSVKCQTSAQVTISWVGRPPEGLQA